MGLKYLYDDSGLGVIVLDGEYPIKIANALVSNAHEAKCLCNIIQFQVKLVCG